MKTCFVLMPFRPSFDHVYGVIRRTARKCGMTALRGDEIHRAGFVMDQVREHIDSADVVVADLSGRNANVFYETAIAHMVKYPHQVILLAQSDRDVPFDLRPRKYLPYKDHKLGRKKLAQDLLGFMNEALQGVSGKLSETIVGRNERTRRIVADCDALLQTGKKTIDSVEVRFGGGLSSLAISPREKHSDPVYDELLQQERKKVEALVNGGALFRGILAPRVTGESVADEEAVTRMGLRFERLIQQLRELDRKASGVQVALIEPCYVTNVFAFGDAVLYDGIKASMGGGFDLSIRLTDRAQIRARVGAFDSLFHDASAYTRRVYGGRSSDLRTACIAGLERLHEEFRRSAKEAGRSGRIRARALPVRK